MEQTAAGSTDQSEVLVGSRQCGDRHHCYLCYKSCDCSPLLRSLSSVHTYVVLTFLPSCYSLSFPVSGFAHGILCLLLSFALDTLAAMIKTQVPAYVTSVHYVTSQQHYTDSCPAIGEATHGLTVHTDMLALQVKVPRMMYSELSPSSCLMIPQLAWLLSSRLPPKQVMHCHVL